MSLQRQARSLIALWTEMVWQHRGTVAGAALALLSVAWIFDEPSKAANALGAVVGAGVTCWDLLRRRQETDQLRFVPRDTDDLVDVADSLGSDGLLIRAGREVGVVLREESRALREVAMQWTLTSDPYRVHPEIAQWSSLFLARKTLKSRMWNAPTIGLASDVPQSGGQVTLRRCSYFDFVATNLMAQNDVYDGRRFDPKPVVDGRRWITERSQAPRSFDDSWLANVIGVSTLAFTTDGKLVVVQQSDKNTGSPGLFAPSGSGALEPQDLDKDRDFVSSIMAGANRELCEETGIDPAAIQSSGILGHGRWLSRGAMPEFSCVTLLSVRAEQVDRLAVPRGERVFTADRHTYRLSPSDAWTADSPLKALPEHVGRSASLPLVLAMSLLAEVLRSGEGPLVIELRNRLAL